MNQLPRGWVKTTLGETCSIISGATPRTSEESYWNGDVSWITPDDLSQYKAKMISKGRRSLTKAGFESCPTRMLPAGSVLFSSRAPIGYVAIAANPVCTNQGFKSLVPAAGIESNYLYWYMQYATEEVKVRASGTTFAEISGKAMASVPLLLPPTSEQNRVVTAIEQQLARLDKAEAGLGQVQRRLMTMKETFFQITAPSSIGEGAEVTVQETIRVIDYRGRTPPFAPSGIPHLRTFNVRDGLVNWQRCAWVTEATYDKYMSRGLPESGDLIFTTEAPMGEVAMAPDTKFCMAQRMMLLKPDTSVWIPEYLMFHLQSPWFQAKLRLSSTGTTVQGISSRNFRPLTLYAPPLKAQADCVDRIREGLSSVQRLHHGVETTNIRSRRLRSSILRAAFSGKLVAQDESDEPADALLERIGSQDRSQTQRARRKRKSVR